MPDIKVPYTPEGEELVENIKEEVEAVGGEIDYSPGGIANAPDMRENYQLEGMPGDINFGQSSRINPPLPEPIKPLLPEPINSPLSDIVPDIGMYEEGGEVPKYKEGKKVKK